MNTQTQNYAIPTQDLTTTRVTARTLGRAARLNMVEGGAGLATTLWLFGLTPRCQGRVAQAVREEYAIGYSLE